MLNLHTSQALESINAWQQYWKGLAEASKKAIFGLLIDRVIADLRKTNSSVRERYEGLDDGMYLLQLMAQYTTLENDGDSSHSKPMGELVQVINDYAQTSKDF